MSRALRINTDGTIEELQVETIFHPTHPTIYTFTPIAETLIIGEPEPTTCYLPNVYAQAAVSFILDTLYTPVYGPAILFGARTTTNPATRTPTAISAYDEARIRWGVQRIHSNGPLLRKLATQAHAHLNHLGLPSLQ